MAYMLLSCSSTIFILHIVLEMFFFFTIFVFYSDSALTAAVRRHNNLHSHWLKLLLSRGKCLLPGSSIFKKYK